MRPMSTPLIADRLPGLCRAAAQAIQFEVVASTGSTNADALQLSAVVNQVSTAASGTGVILPPLEPGASVFVMNSGANALLVYPGTGFQINALTATTQGFSVASGGRAQFIAFTSTRWGAILSA